MGVGFFGWGGYYMTKINTTIKMYYLGCLFVKMLFFYILRFDSLPMEHKIKTEYGHIQSKIKEQLSEAYLRTLLAYLGLSHAKYQTDHAKIDDSIKYELTKDEKKECSFPVLTIYLQLKCTDVSEITEDENYLSYKLNDTNAYNKFEDEKPGVGHVSLFLISILPENIREWLEISEKELILRMRTYYIRVAGMGQTQNKSSITLKINKKEALFTPDKLVNLIKTFIAEGKENNL